MTNNRYLNDKKVTPIWYCDYYSTPKVRGILAGEIDGETVVDNNGRPIPYKQIGELEGKKHAPEQPRRRRK